MDENYDYSPSVDVYGAAELPVDYATFPPTMGTPGAPSGGLTSKDGLSAFNNLLGAWLTHDTNSMRVSQPNGYPVDVYGRPVYGMAPQGSPVQTNNSGLIKMLLIFGAVYLVLKKV